MKLLMLLGIAGAGLSVLLGAFAAHGLKSRLDPYALDVFQTGVQYQFYHSLGLILVGLSLAQWLDSSALLWSGRLFAVGIVLFSGSLYLVSLLGIRWLGAITPIGGLAFVAGWVLFAWAVYKAPGA
ncbi:MAG: hypothetical protein COB04_10030 [Gammaproteobacteria bacterium]|nr:MAG: hypothetical protein COB04_10030 [Gammaproteobacteria bacterium]